MVIGVHSIFVLVAFLSCRPYAFIYQRQPSIGESHQLLQQRGHSSSQEVPGSFDAHINEQFAESRRTFLSRPVVLVPQAAATLSLLNKQVCAQESVETTTSTLLFNADGSLKEEEKVEKEAKFRTVEYLWRPFDVRRLGVDGLGVSLVDDTDNNKSGAGKVRLSYQLPEKWVQNGEVTYYDRASQGKACNRIWVYQAPGKADEGTLKKAATIGIAKVLQTTDELSELMSADLMSGRTVSKSADSGQYFEFDLAIAPKSCGSSSEDLGLGFCPYESIYLLAATILDEKLYVFALQSDKAEWKRSNSDLRQVRSSFRVNRAS